VPLGEIYDLYINLNMRFKSDAFESYKFLLHVRYDSIIVRWIIYLNTRGSKRDWGTTFEP